MLRRSLVCVLVTLLAACASAPYQPEAYGGGYSETRLDTNVFQVSYRGNASVSAAKASDLAMLRAAHLTLMHGFSYFVIIDRSASTSRSSTTMPTTSTTTGHAAVYGNQAFVSAKTRNSGGDTITFEKPSSSLTIACFKEKPDAPSVGINAAMVAQQLAPRYGINLSEIAPGSAPN